ncbi:MAG: bifunctional glutamate N-acetyltransferase/amino-acid acetyltransferase ArgJ [Dehalococcoidia bacterium]
MHHIQTIPDGHVTTPAGFRAGAVFAGIKTYGQDKLDLGILASDTPCTAAGVYTKSTVKGAPVIVTQRHLVDQRARAIVVNAGCANVATGAQGMADAEEMTRLAAALAGCAAGDVAVCSTGVIGRPLPMERIREGIERIELRPDGGADLARAIMTTDTRPKGIAAAAELDGHRYTTGGIAKGSGMIHPDMATMFGFLTADAPLTPTFADAVLRRVVDRTFNMVSVDNDTSTSDTVLLLANGAAEGPPIEDGTPAAEAFEAALNAVALHLAREITRDGEGATKLIEVRITGAANPEEARAAARTITASPLMKSAVYGNDPNWGRVMMAIGRSGAFIDLDRASVRIGDMTMYADGRPHEPDGAAVRAALAGPDVVIAADLGAGPHVAIAWGCDLTENYVRINADYTT